MLNLNKKRMKKKIIIAWTLLFLPIISFSQDIFKTSNFNFSKKTFQQVEEVQKYQLNETLLLKSLLDAPNRNKKTSTNTIISFPNKNGHLEKFIFKVFF